MVIQTTAYQSLLNALQEKGKLSAAELKKVERVKQSAVSESLPAVTGEIRAVFGAGCR